MARGSYTAKDIEVLEGLEPVRERPGMYIAGTSTPEGLHQLAFEILDNSVDEAMNGHASEIELMLHKDSSTITVSDNGRGIPVEKHPKFKKPALELILTTLHAGGKFSDRNYQASGGLHGVGSSVVNALSQEMIAQVKRGGKLYEQRYSRGKVKTKLKVVKSSVKGTGTLIQFRPDPQIFKSTTFSAPCLLKALKVRAYLNPGLNIKFIDEAAGTKEEFVYKEGLREYLDEILSEKKLSAIGEVFTINRDNGTQVLTSFAWTESTKEEFQSYANGIHTSDGGSHEVGAKNGIIKAARNYSNVHDALPKGVKLSADDIREGLICLVSVKLPIGEHQAQFQGQTKSKLNNPELAPIVESVTKQLEQRLNENPTVAKAIVERVVLAAKARAASRAASKSVNRKVGVSHRLNLPGKLADCSSTRTEQTELIIVEGDSAGGSAKQARDRKTQAILPLRGKVLNALVSSPKKIVENKELSNIISALGCGVGEGLKVEKLRYGKIVILTDADADGMHISTLLLAFFFSQMRGLVDAGRIFLGKPPLYGVFPSGKVKQKGPFWAYSEEELEQLLKDGKFGTPRIVRYKGLGEMNPDTLWDTTLSPKTRTLLRVTMDDAEQVQEALLALMGSDSSTRTELIQEYAEQLDLDI